MGAATAIEWRWMQTEPKAVVRSTVPEVRAEAVTAARRLQTGEVRKPVTGEVRTGETDEETAYLVRKGVAGNEGNAKTGAETKGTRNSGHAKHGDGGDGGGADTGPGGLGKQSGREAGRANGFDVQRPRGEPATP